MRQLYLQSENCKFLENLPPKQFRQVVTKVFELLGNPKPHDAQTLKGYPYCRTDVGEYRIIYRFDDRTVAILVIGKRNDDEVYRRLARLG